MNSTILTVKNVSKSYASHQALTDVSMTIEKGQIVGLLGPNGSGKTTLIKIINTLITEYTGEILICGSKPGIPTKKRVSYLPDADFLRKDISIRGAVSMYADLFADFDKTKCAEMLKVVKLDPKMRISTLSKGMKEKLHLVLTMARQASLYVFDEPIAGVDPAARDFILDTIIKNYNEDGAILFSTHLIGDVEAVLSHFVFIKEGRIVMSGDTDETREKTGQSIDRLFREEFKC